MLNDIYEFKRINEALHKEIKTVLNANRKLGNEIKRLKKKLFYFTSAPKNIQSFNDISYNVQINGNLSINQIELLSYMFQEKETEIDDLKRKIRRLEHKIEPKTNKIKSSKLTNKTYLIKNSRNELYKIGRSSNPLNREKTLQAEEPLIKIVKLWDKNIEKSLHKKYKDYRVRGEWFKLNKVQVKYICTHY